MRPRVELLLAGLALALLAACGVADADSTERVAGPVAGVSVTRA